jgi:hypothetical protein
MALVKVFFLSSPLLLSTHHQRHEKPIPPPSETGNTYSTTIRDRKHLFHRIPLRIPFVHRERIPYLHRFLLLQMEKEKNNNTVNFFLVGNPQNRL